MSFKTHLIIITIILIIVYFARMLMPAEVVAPAPAPQQVDNTEYKISVVRASWGLNCRAAPSSDDSYKNTGTKTLENNVISQVSNRCNGQTQCDIPVDVANLGADPMPSCISKQLLVDYRCFSFDRLWTAKASAGVLSIKCEKPAQ